LSKGSIDFAFQIWIFRTQRREVMPWITGTDINMISFLQRWLSLINHDKQGGGVGPLLNQDAKGFTLIKINISLT